MSNKCADPDDVVASLSDGMTIGIGGWAARRKPMSLVRAIARSDLKNLTLVSYGGPDVGLLCATGQVSTVVFGFVTLDVVTIDPHFAKARQTGAVSVNELDEAMLLAGLRAAADRLPFHVMRGGIGSDALHSNPHIKTITSPYADHEELVAMPALHLDAAFIHLNKADVRGNAAYTGPDPYFDDLYCLAADRTFVSAEQVVPTSDLAAAGSLERILINRAMVEGVVESPHGAHFTSCAPDYGLDESFMRHYVAAADSPAAWSAFRSRFIDCSEADYQHAVAELAKQT